MRTALDYHGHRCNGSGVENNVSSHSCYDEEIVNDVSVVSQSKNGCVCAHASCGCAIGYVYDRQTVSGVYVGRASWTAL